MRKILWAIFVVLVTEVFAQFVINPLFEFITDGDFRIALTITNVAIAIAVTIPPLIIGYLIWQRYERKRFGANFAFFGKAKKISRYIFGTNGLFPNEYYLDWEVDDEIEALLRSGKYLLILGRRFAGKTRAAYEAMMLMKRSYVAVVGDKGVSAPDLQKPLSVRKMILFVDDLNKYEPEKMDFDGIRQKFGRKKLLIVATCREGTEYYYVSDKGRFGDFIGRCTAFTVRNATRDEGEKIAEGVGKEELGEFDGTAGSAAADVRGMRKIYCDIPPEKVDILHTLRIFFEAGTFEVARGYLRDLYGRVYGYETDETPFLDMIRALEGDGFVREAEGGYRARHDVYFGDDFQERFSDENLDSYIAVLERLAIEEWQDADILSSLGYSYYTGIEYERATAMYASALEIREEKLGPDHPDVATTLNNLGDLFRVQGCYNEAEPLYERSLETREKVLRPEHPDVAQSLNNLALLYAAQGRYDEAEPLYERSLEIKEKALGPEHNTSIATTLNNLAGLYKAQGRYSKAEPLFKRSLGIFEKALGPDHPSVAVILNNLAELYRAQGRYDKAEPLYLKDLEITENALGPDHPDLAKTLNNLAGLYKDQGRYDEAEPLYKRSLGIREEALSATHPDVAQSLNNLALLYEAQGRYPEAEPLYLRDLEITEKALGPDHPDLATTLNNLAHLNFEQGNPREALKYQERAHEILENKLPANHPKIINSFIGLSTIYGKLNQPEKAAECARRAEELQRYREEGEEEPAE